MVPRSGVITILGRVCGAVNEDALFLVQLLLKKENSKSEKTLPY